MAFFLALAFSGLAPLAGIAILHSHEEMMAFAGTYAVFITLSTPHEYFVLIFSPSFPVFCFLSSRFRFLRYSLA